MGSFCYSVLMTIKKTTQVDDPVIRTKAKNVTNPNSKTVKRVIRDLTDSMREHGLVGMAAPQVGESLRIFVTEIRKTKFRAANEIDELRVFINPVVKPIGNKTATDWEGCGSVAEAGLFGKVKRPAKVEVSALNEQGEKFTLKATGLLARVVQHELDHLNGVLFIDTVDTKTCMSRNEYLQMKLKK